MAFNKAKTLQAAEKYLAQGKISHAIEQYQNIFKHDPRDLSLLNTIGDLYIRLGHTAEAMNHFQRLAEAYVTEGFLMRAIAIYKKMAKLDTSQVGVLEKLAELYAVQGLMSEARSQFLQVAETYIKANLVDKALTIFRKMLSQDPDNVSAHLRLAELCERIGKTGDALEAYLRAAERLAQKQDHKECLRLTEKILGMEGKHARARMLKARSLLATGHASAAITLLEPLAEADDSCAMLLLECYLSSEQLPHARLLGERIFDSKPERYDLLFAIACHHEEGGEARQALELLERIAGAMIEHDETEKLVSRVESLSEKGDVAIPALELLKQICLRTGEHFRVPDILDRIADAWAKKGDHGKAREVLEELVRVEPDNPHHLDRLNQLLILMGDQPQPMIPPAQPAGFEEDALTLAEQQPAGAEGSVERTEDQLDSGTLKRLTSALTDADLMSSYGRHQKAIEILESALELVPSHPPALEKLLDLYLGTGDWSRVADYAEQLSRVYADRGSQRQADRFRELANRYRKQAIAPPMPVPPEAVALASRAEADTMAEPPADQAAAEEGALLEAILKPDGSEAVHEIDLSEEWEKIAGATGAPAAASPGFNLAEVREEVEFYIREGLADEALSVIDKLAQQFPGELVLAELREKAVAAKAAGAVESPEGTLVPRPETEDSTILFDFEDIATGTLETEHAAAPAESKTIAAQERVEQRTVEAPTPLPLVPSEPVQGERIGEEVLPPAYRESPATEPVFAASVAAEPVSAESPAPSLEEPTAAEPFLNEPGAGPSEETTWRSPGLVLEAAPPAEVVQERAAEPEPAAPVTQVPLVSPAAAEFTLRTESGSTEAEAHPAEPIPVELSAVLPFQESAQAASPGQIETPSEPLRPAEEVETLELVLETQAAAGPPPAVPVPERYSGDQFLSDLAAEFEILAEPGEAPGVAQSRMAGFSPATGAEQLNEVLEEFRQELGETEEVEDAETHYNLGIAYKEMGLLDEAISEFQKAFKIINRGQSGASRMECCVQLAVCFMDKAMPQIAIKWYLKGLESPGLEPESVLALRYDLGVAYELAGDLNRALECYQEVYAMNIDYRDVADRISALSRPRA
jgi:tetratricopeptide (TPR) repeat protein